MLRLITIDISDNSIPLSDITEQIVAIDLETTEHSLIDRSIWQVHIYQDYLIIKDGSPYVQGKRI